MLRHATIIDFDFIYDLYMHPKINPFLLYEWMPKDDFRPIFDELLDKKCIYILSIDSQDVGMCKLLPMPHRNSHILYLGGVAICSELNGKGIGALMMQEVIVFAKMNGFLRIELSTASTNDNAIRLYEKCGFEKEGLLRKYTFLKSENCYVDEVVMSYLVEE